MTLFLKNLPKSFFREIVSSRPVFNKATSLFSSIANNAQKAPVYAVGRNYARSICFESHNEDKKRSLSSKYPIYRRRYSKKVKKSGKSSLEASKKPSGVECTVNKGVMECSINCAALGKGTQKIESCGEEKKSAAKVPEPKKKLPKYKKEETQSSRPDVQALTGTWVSKKCIKFDFSCEGVKLEEAHRPIRLEDKKPSQLFEACQKASTKELARKASKTPSKVSLSSKKTKTELVEPCKEVANKPSKTQSKVNAKTELVEPCKEATKKPSNEKPDQSPVMECIAICKKAAKKPSGSKESVGEDSKKTDKTKADQSPMMECIAICKKGTKKPSGSKENVGEDSKKTKDEKSCKPCKSKTEKKKVTKASPKKQKVSKKASKEKRADPCSSKEPKTSLAGGVEEDSILDDKCREIINKLRKELEECRKMNAKHLEKKNPCVESPKLDSKLPEAKCQDKDVISGSKTFIKTVCGGMFKDKPGKSKSAPVVKKHSKKVRATKSEDLQVKPCQSSAGEAKKSKKEEMKTKKVCKTSKSKEKKVTSLGLVHPCKNASKIVKKKSKERKKEAVEVKKSSSQYKKPSPPCTYAGPQESKSAEEVCGAKEVKIKEKKRDPCAKYKAKVKASVSKSPEVQKKKSSEVQKKKSSAKCKVKTSASKGSIKSSGTQKLINPCPDSVKSSASKRSIKSSGAPKLINPCAKSAKSPGSKGSTKSLEAPKLINPCPESQKSKVKSSASKGSIKSCDVETKKSSSGTKKKVKCSKSAEERRKKSGVTEKKKSATKTSSKCATKKKEESKADKTCSSTGMKKRESETPELQDQSPIMQCIALCRANKPQKGKGVPPRDKKAVSSDPAFKKKQESKTAVSSDTEACMKTAKKEEKDEIKEFKPCMYEDIKPGIRKPEDECGEKEEEIQECQENETKIVLQPAGNCPKFKYACPSSEKKKDPSVSEDKEIEEQRRRVEKKNAEVIEELKKKDKGQTEKGKIQAASSNIFKNIYSFFSLKSTPKEKKSSQDILNSFNCEEHLKNKEKLKDKQKEKPKDNEDESTIQIKSSPDVCKKESKLLVKDKTDNKLKIEDISMDKNKVIYVCLPRRSKTKFETSLSYGQFPLCPLETNETQKKKDETKRDNQIISELKKFNIGQLPKTTKSSAGLLCKTEDNKAQDFRLKHTDSNEEKDCEEQESQKCDEEVDKFEECVEEVEYEVVKEDKQRCPKFKFVCPEICEESKEKDCEEKFEECLEEINEEECKEPEEKEMKAFVPCKYEEIKPGIRNECEESESKKDVCEPKQKTNLIYPCKPEENRKATDDKSKQGIKLVYPCKPEISKNDDKKLPVGENTSLLIIPYANSSASSKNKILKLVYPCKPKDDRKTSEEKLKKCKSSSESKPKEKIKLVYPCKSEEHLKSRDDSSKNRQEIKLVHPCKPGENLKSSDGSSKNKPKQVKLVYPCKPGDTRKTSHDASKNKPKQEIKLVHPCKPGENRKSSDDSSKNKPKQIKLVYPCKAAENRKSSETTSKNKPKQLKLIYPCKPGDNRKSSHDSPKPIKLVYPCKPEDTRKTRHDASKNKLKQEIKLVHPCKPGENLKSSDGSSKNKPKQEIKLVHPCKPGENLKSNDSSKSKSKQEIKLVHPCKPGENRKTSDAKLKKCKSSSENKPKQDIKLIHPCKPGESKASLTCKPKTSANEMKKNDNTKIPSGENTSLIITPYKKSSAIEILKLLEELKKDVEECKRQIGCNSSKVGAQKPKLMGPCMESPNLKATLPKVSPQKKGAVGGSVSLVKDICKAFSPGKNVKPKKIKSADLIKKKSNQELKKTKSDNVTMRKQKDLKKTQSIKDVMIKKQKDHKQDVKKTEGNDINLRYCCRFTRKEMDKATRDNAVRDRKKLREKESEQKRSQTCSQSKKLTAKNNLLRPCPGNYTAPPNKKTESEKKPETRSPCRNENTTKPITACPTRNYSMKDDQNKKKQLNKCKSSPSVDKTSKKPLKKIKSDQCPDRLGTSRGTHEIKQFLPCKYEDIKPGIRKPDGSKGSKSGKPSAPCKYTSPTREKEETKSGESKKEEIKQFLPCKYEEIKPGIRKPDDTKSRGKGSKQWVRPPPPCKLEPPKVPEKTKKESKKDEIKQFVPCKTEVIKPGIREPDDVKVGKTSKRWVRPHAPCEYTEPEKKSKPSKCIMDKYIPPKFIYPCATKDTKQSKEDCGRKKLVHPCGVKKQEGGKKPDFKSFTVEEKKLKPLVVCKKTGEIKLKECKPGGTKPKKKEKMPHLVTCSDKPCQHQKKKCVSEPSLREKPQKPVKESPSLNTKIKKCIFGGKSKSRPVVSTKTAMKAKTLSDPCKERSKKIDKESPPKECKEQREKLQLVYPCEKATKKSDESVGKANLKPVYPCEKTAKKSDQSGGKAHLKLVYPCEKATKKSDKSIGKASLKPLVECVGVCRVKNKENHVKKLVEFYDSKDKCQSSKDSVDVLVPPKYSDIVSKIDQKVVKVQCFTIENEKSGSGQKEEIKQFVPCKYEEIKPGIRKTEDQCQNEEIKHSAKDGKIKLVVPCKYEEIKQSAKDESKKEGKIKMVIPCKYEEKKQSAGDKCKEGEKIKQFVPCKFEEIKPGIRGPQTEKKEESKSIKKCPKFKYSCPDLQKKESKGKPSEKCQTGKKKEDICKEKKKEVKKEKCQEIKDLCPKKDRASSCGKEAPKCAKKDDKKETCKPKETKAKSKEDICNKSKKDSICKSDKKEKCQEIKDLCSKKDKTNSCGKKEPKCEKKKEDACKETKKVASCQEIRNICPAKDKETKYEKGNAIICQPVTKKDACKEDKEVAPSKSCPKFKNPCPDTCEQKKKDMCKGDNEEACKPKIKMIYPCKESQSKDKKSANPCPAKAKQEKCEQKPVKSPKSDQDACAIYEDYKKKTEEKKNKKDDK